jgi:hypothetical protein
LTIHREPTDPAAYEWPAEADLIVSALDVAGPADANRRGERRTGRRTRHRATAELVLFADADEKPLYLLTRDINPGGLGFVTRTRLPLGYAGRVRLKIARLDIDTICTVYRCRPCATGWFEGALRFNHPVPELQPTSN